MGIDATGRLGGGTGVEAAGGGGGRGATAAFLGVVLVLVLVCTVRCASTPPLDCGLSGEPFMLAVAEALALPLLLLP